MKNILLGLLTSVIFSAIIYYRFHIWYALLRLYTPKTSNPENDKIIRSLHPVFAYKVAKFVNEVEKEVGPVILNSGKRENEEQQILYDMGQTSVLPGGSYHNYGLAIDMNVQKPGNFLQMEDSSFDWLPVADISKKYGFRWGGDFESYNHDPVHFDYGNKVTIEQAKNLFNDKKTVKNYIKIV